MTNNRKLASPMCRRAFLSTLTLAGASALVGTGRLRQALAQGQAPAVITPDTMRPALPSGVASGDITSQAAIVWSRSDRPARMLVEYATTESLRNARRFSRFVASQSGQST